MTDKAGLRTKRSTRGLSPGAAAVAVAGLLALVVVAALVGRDPVKVPSTALSSSVAPSPGIHPPTPSPRPTPETPEPPTPDVGPTATPGRPQPPPTEPATPRPDLTERERSDLYWGALTDYGPYSLTWDSLADMTLGVDVVVRGRITDTRLMAFGAFAADAGHAQIVFGVVTVDEILKGAPELHEGTIEISGLGWTEIPPEDLPKHEHVFFVVGDSVVIPEAGVAPRDWGIHSYYARPNGYQAVLRDIGGKIRLINGPRGWQEAFGPFPSGLNGDSFDDVVERIRQFVKNSP